MSSQERRLMRRMGNQGAEARAPRALVYGSGGTLPGPDPEYVREQQDRQRDQLAERLLEVGLDQLNPYDFSDTAVVRLEDGEQQPQVTVTDWYRKLAHGALAAAEVIYPELPEAGESEEERRENRVYPLPPAAQAGAESVGGGHPDRPLGGEI